MKYHFFSLFSDMSAIILKGKNKKLKVGGFQKKRPVKEIIPQHECGVFVDTITYSDLSFSATSIREKKGYFLIEDIAIPVLRKLSIDQESGFGKAVISANINMQQPVPRVTGLEDIVLIAGSRKFNSFSTGGVPNRIKNIEVVGVSLDLFEEAVAKEGFSVKTFCFFFSISLKKVVQKK